MTLRAGDRLGPYEILFRLGAGGMGEVYSALDARLRREVAIKVLPAEDTANEERRRAFQREARAASALNHPNIVTIHEIDCENGIDFIVMERVEGQTLRDLIPAEGMSIEKVLEYFPAIALALERAHRAGIVHRDLKPGNIMVTSGGQVKVLDFGVAKLVRATESPTSSGDTETVSQAAEALGGLTGTSAYMSPEQATGRPVDTRADIFSLGIVLYEALAGKRPWDGSTGLAVLQGVCLLDPPPLKAVRPGLPSALVSIVEKALRKAPEERYQTMEQFAGALREFAAGRSNLGRNRRQILLAALTVAGACSTLAALYFVPRMTIGDPKRAAASSAPAVTVSDAFEAYREARTLLVRYDRPQNVDRAVGLLEAAVRKESAHAPFHAALSDAYVLKYGEARDPKYLGLAETSVTAALKLNPYLAAAHVSRAALDVASGKPDEAIRNLRRALELDPKNAEARWRLAPRLSAAGQAGEAPEMARRAAELAPDDWRSHMALGSVAYASGNYPEALSEFERALKLAPDNPLLFQNMAGVYHSLDRWEDAAAMLQRALEIRPTANAYSNLGTVLYFQGRFEEAVTAFERAAQLRPNEYIYQGNLADAYRWSPARKSDAVPAYAKALAQAQDTLRTRPTDASLRASIAAYLAKSGRTAEALKELETLPPVERRPSVLSKVALVRELAGDRAGALTALKAGLAAGLSFHEIDHDPEFSELRKDSGFQSLAKRVRR